MAMHHKEECPQWLQDNQAAHQNGTQEAAFSERILLLGGLFGFYVNWQGSACLPTPTRLCEHLSGALQRTGTLIGP